MKVSVIIAVYNGEQYIKRCINSFLSADIPNLEVIVIDDGSTDSTVKRLEPFINDRRLLIISQENKGVSCARNLGIENSHGEWLFFCDADDWVETQIFEETIGRLASLKDDCGVCLIGANFVYSDRVVPHKVEPRRLSNVDFLQGANFRLASWNYFFRSANILKYNIRYPEGVVCAEDQNFNLKCICSSPSVYCYDAILYNYDQTNFSSASKSKHDEKWIKSRLWSVYDLVCFCSYNNFDVSILNNQIERFYESYLYDFSTKISIEEKGRFYKSQYRKLTESHSMLLKPFKFKMGLWCFPLCSLLFYIYKKFNQ